MVENKSGEWRYRIGDYRIICEIQDEKIIVLVLEVGHRKNIYNNIEIDITNIMMKNSILSGKK